MKIPKEVRSLIESGTPAHLVTLNRDGSPQVTLVWIGLDGDEIVAAHLPEESEGQESPARSTCRHFTAGWVQKLDGPDRIRRSLR